MPTEQVLLIFWLVLSYLAIFIGWRFPGHYHLASASAAFDSRRPGVLTFCRGSSDVLLNARWRWIRTGIVGAAALPAIGFLVGAFVVRTQTLDFLPIVQTDRQGDEPERSYLCLGKSPATLQFFRPADGDAFRELLTPGWRLRQPAS